MFPGACFGVQEVLLGSGAGLIPLVCGDGWWNPGPAARIINWFILKGRWLYYSSTVSIFRMNHFRFLPTSLTDSVLCSVISCQLHTAAELSVAMLWEGLRGKLHAVVQLSSACHPCVTVVETHHFWLLISAAVTADVTPLLPLPPQEEWGDVNSLLRSFFPVWFQLQ